MTDLISDADAIFLENIKPKKLPRTFKFQKWNVYNDSNNNSYSGNQLNFSPGALQNGNEAQLLSESFLLIPQELRITHYGATDSPPFAYAATVKSSHALVVDNIQFMMGGVTLQQNCQNECILRNMKMLISHDPQSVRVEGPSIGFIPDSASEVFSSTAGPSNNDLGGTGAWILSKLSAANGITGAGSPASANTPITGSMDGLAFPYSVAVGGTYRAGFNSGLLERCQRVTGFAPSSPDVGGLISQNDCDSLLRNYCFGVTTTAGAPQTVYRYLAQIKMSDVSDAFSRLDFPILSPNISLTIGINRVIKAQITGTSGPAAPAWGLSNQITLSSSAVCPVMLTNVAFNLAGCTSTQVEQSIGLPLLSTTQLYIPSVVLDADTIQELRDQNDPSRDSSGRVVEYLFTNKYPITQGNGQSVNAQVAQIAQPVAMYVFTNLAPSNTCMGGIAHKSSIVSSNPSTTIPYIDYYNVQVMLATQQLYPQFMTYDYDMYTQQVAEFQQTFQWASNGMGLISMDDWNKSYKVLVCNLSRLLSSSVGQAAIPINLQFQVKCNSAYSLEHTVYVDSLKRVRVNAFTGTVTILNQ